MKIFESNNYSKNAESKLAEANFKISGKSFFNFEMIKGQIPGPGIHYEIHSEIPGIGQRQNEALSMLISILIES